MVNKQELWQKILIELNNYAMFLEASLVKEDSASWKEYFNKVKEVYKFTEKWAANSTASDANMVTGSITGLSRYFDEFEWDSDTYKGAKEYLVSLAMLRVDLLNAYGL